MLRRLAALLMLFTIAFGSAEKVVGELRENEVHHESVAEATAHSVLVGADAAHAHGHDHDECALSGPDHEHGTPADHCTHHHGTLATVAVPALSVTAYVYPEDLPDRVVWHDRTEKPSIRPPQA